MQEGTRQGDGRGDTELLPGCVPPSSLPQLPGDGQDTPVQVLVGSPGPVPLGDTQGGRREVAAATMGR